MRVLLGVGGSDESLQALHQAVERAIAAGDDLTVAILEQVTGTRSVGAIETDVREAIEGAGLDAEIRNIEGHPGSELVDMAESEGFDQIVLSGGTTSPMGKIQISSVTEFVLLNSHVSVTLVR